MSEYKPPIGRKEPMLPENLPGDHKGKPPKPVNWRKVERALNKKHESRERNKKIERVLWVLLGFVIGALAMYTSFPK